MRVLLFVEAEDLRTLRWEQLCAPLDRGWDYLLLNQATPFSLFLPSQIERRFPPIGRRDLRALILIAGPEDLSIDYKLSAFDIPATVAGVHSAFGSIPADILANTENAIGKPTLENLGSQLVSGQYTLLHIVCHGAYQQDSGETILYLPKDERGKATNGTDLINRLSRMERLPQFTFLSTCESADPQAESGLGGLGQRLVRDLGMPAVLAMTDKISIKTAGALATSFYKFLGEHGEVDRALGDAAVSLQGRFDVTVPALFSRLGGRALFSDTLNRPLTPTEINYGLDTLWGLIKLRAPVLLPEFESNSKQITSTLSLNSDTLSADTRRERGAAQDTVNRLSGEVLDLSFNALALGKTPPTYDERCPFPGLMHFKPEDKGFFFGREVLVEKLIARLKEHNFLAVLGPSGSGKSSLVLAGLIPALGAEMIYMTPSSEPLAQLESVLKPGNDSAVVIVDQFEELFTLTSAEDKRRGFIDQLLEASQSRKVVITMRADFWGEVASYKSIKDEMQAHQELVAPMDAAELRRAMELQAATVGLRFEADLSQDILDDVQGEPGAMPLLQHALLLLWNRRHGRWLRIDEYRSIGGVQKAIAGTADELYDNVSSDDKERVRGIFVRLTRLDHESSGEENRDTRRRVNLSELIPAGSGKNETLGLIRKLADARLIVTSEDPTALQQQVEVAHEALIRYWPRLRNWLAEDRASLRLREGVREAALEWDTHQRDASLLVHRAGRLEDAIALNKQARFALNALEQNYLDACLAFQEKERATKERLRRNITISLAIGFVIVLGVAIAAVFQWRRANRQSLLAFSRELAAQSQNYVTDSPSRSLLLAIESLNITSKIDQSPLAVSQEALRSALNDPHGTPLAGHELPITSAAISMDGKWLATGSEDAAIRLWDLGSSDPSAEPLVLKADYEIQSLAFSPDGKWLAAGSAETALLWYLSNVTADPVLLEGHFDTINALAFSHDGHWLATGSMDQTVLMWDMRSADPAQNPRTFEIDGGEVTALAFNPKNDRLAVGSIDHDIRVWDVAKTDDAPIILSGHEKMISALAFSPDGKWLASGSRDNTARLWDTNDLSLPALILNGHQDWINALAFSHNGHWLATASGDGTARLWDLASLQVDASPLVLRGHASMINTLAFSADDHWIATGSADKTIRLWDLTAPDPVRNPGVLRGHDDQVRALAFSPNGYWLASGSDDHAARLWNVQRSNPAESAAVLRGHGDQINALAISKNGNWLAAGGGNPANESQDNSVLLWKMNPAGAIDPPIKLEGHTGPVLSLAISADDRWLASGSTDTTIRLWDLTSQDPSSKPNVLSGHEKSITQLLFSQDGHWLASSGVDQMIRVWNLTPNDSSSRTLAGNGERITALAISEDDHWLASANGNVIRIWDMTHANASPIELVGHEDTITTLAFNSDGHWLASGSRDSFARLWDANDWSSASVVLKGHTDWITTLAFSLDGKWLATGSRDRSVLLWDTHDPGADPSLLSGHQDTINALAFSLDGKWLATGSDDRTAILWDLSTTNPINNPVILRGHESQITTLVFSPDDRWLVTGGADNTVRLWRLSLAELIDQACASAGRNLFPSEWSQYFPEQSFEATCPTWSANP